jgi:hypothetical protein
LRGSVNNPIRHLPPHPAPQHHPHRVETTRVEEPTHLRRGA